MRFLLLLFPNLYDIFSVLMMGYAWFLNSNSQLKIPFGLACLFIYIATRVGIFAGEIIRLMIGSSSIEEENMEEPADVVAKRMVLEVGPQTICVIICQVIVALCFLQGPASAKMTTPISNSNAQEQAQVATQNEVVSPVTEAANLNIEKPETSNIEPAVKEDEAEVVPVATNKTFKKLYKAKNDKQKLVEAPAKEQAVTNTKSSVYYDIPDKTLMTVGISPASRRIAYSADNNAVVPAANNNGNWNFSAANNVRVAQNAAPVSQYQQPVQQVNTASNAGANTKRYPGDDNPVNVHWGYYRYAESIPGARTQGNNTNYSTVPVPYTRW